jgi:tRNA A37 methylthiotransferase MiaB
MSDAAAAPSIDAASGVRRIAVITPGRELNQADSESIARRLGSAGVEVIDRTATSDSCEISTCSVKHVGGRKARYPGFEGDAP